MSSINLRLYKNRIGGGNKRMSEICIYTTSRISYANISAENYVSTDNLLQNCEGVTTYKGQPNTDSVIEYHKGDILLSNIRPYLKKIWLATHNGGCNTDVLVIRTIDKTVLPEYVFYILQRQKFFDYVMTNVKGMKMPRGNKDHIMRYEIPLIDIEKQKVLIHEIQTYEDVIAENKKIMSKCELRKAAVLNKYLAR